MTTIQINLVQVLGGASAILAIAWAIILMISRLRKMEPTVTAIIIALLGIITTMWLIGIETPDTNKFMWYVVLLAAHFSGFTLAMTALQGQCNNNVYGNMDNS